MCGEGSLTVLGPRWGSTALSDTVISRCGRFLIGVFRRREDVADDAPASDDAAGLDATRAGTHSCLIAKACRDVRASAWWEQGASTWRNC